MPTLHIGSENIYEDHQENTEINKTRSLSLRLLESRRGAETLL